MSLIEKINKKKETRARNFEKMKKLVKSAEEEERDMNAQEESEWDSLNKEISKIGKEVDRLERQLELENDMSKSQGRKINPKADDPGSEEERVMATDEYRSAYWKFLRQGRGVLPADQLRALKIGSDPDGGHLVPDEYEATLVDKLENENIMRQLATVITTTSGDRKIPVVSGKTEAHWTAEEGEYTKAKPSFGSKSLGAHKLTALTLVSEELLNDSAFSIDDFLSNDITRAMGRKEETACVIGDGDGKPNGVVPAATLGKEGSLTDGISSDELLEIYHSLKRPYRESASWLFADSTALAIRKLKDQNDQYIWQPGLQAGQPDRLLRRPVAISDDVPELGATNRSILLGDFSYYWIADRQNTAIQRLVELYAENGQIGFRSFKRLDGLLVLDEAIVAFQNASA